MSLERTDPTRGSRPDRLRPLPKMIGRYEILRPLGTGAMGRVLLALDPVLGREVAIKILRADLAIPEDVREGLVVRMRHEARAAARVTHPNLVVLHDMGEDAELGLYLVFELLEGPTLREKIAERRLGAREAARLAQELGDALAFAHARGVLHRDVKPDNIMLTPTGAKIADFGIARVPDSTLTQTGGLLGTPAYSAPETFTKGAFSAASDQFSLAATLYEAVSGERAFPGDDAVLVAARIASGAADPFAERLGYGKDVDAVFARATAAAPADRFESCAAFGAALSRALRLAAGELRVGGGPPRDGDEDAADTERDGPAAEPRTSAGEPHLIRSSPPARQATKPWRVLVGGLVVVAMVALLVRALLKNRDAALAEPQPTTTTTTTTTAPASASAAPSTSSHTPDVRSPHRSTAPALPATVDVPPSAPARSADGAPSTPASSPPAPAGTTSAAPSASP